MHLRRLKGNFKEALSKSLFFPPYDEKCKQRTVFGCVTSRQCRISAMNRVCQAFISIVCVHVC